MSSIRSVCETNVGMGIRATRVSVNELLVNDNILNDGHWHLSGQFSIEALVVCVVISVNNSVASWLEEISVDSVISKSWLITESGNFIGIVVLASLISSVLMDDGLVIVILSEFSSLSSNGEESGGKRFHLV